MSLRGTLAGVATSGQIVMSGATTDSEMLQQALVNWPVLKSTRKRGPPPRIDAKLCKLYGPPPQHDAEYYRG